MPANSEHPDYSAHQGQWQRCRDAYAGTDAVKEAGDAYLPHLGAQTTEEYEAYKARALFYGATERTVQGLTGAAVNKPFQFNLPDGLNYLIQDATDSKMSLDNFVQMSVQELLLCGRIGVLVERNAAGDNPYLVQYDAAQIINWEQDAAGNLIRVVLHETFLERDPEDAYKIISKDRWRELVMEKGAYMQRLHVWNAAKDGFITTDSIPSRRNVALPFIPFVFINANGLSTGMGRPPLLSLVDVNLSHYRNSADLEHGRHFVGLPTPYVTGATVETELRIGSSSAWVFPDPSTGVGFLEFSGAGLSALEKALETKEAMMAILGARLLEGQRPGVEAAETVRLRQLGDVYTLAGITSSLADGLALALSYADRWQGGKGDITVEPNTDFTDTSLSSQEITALVQCWQAGGISRQTLLFNLQRGERLNPENTIEDEIALIDSEQSSLSGLPALTPAEQAALNPV